MTDLVSKPTPEVLLLQKELDKQRNELKQDRAIFEHFKYQAERKLNDEVISTQNSSCNSHLKKL